MCVYIWTTLNSSPVILFFFLAYLFVSARFFSLHYQVFIIQIYHILLCSDIVIYRKTYIVYSTQTVDFIIKTIFFFYIFFSKKDFEIVMQNPSSRYLRVNGRNHLQKSKVFHASTYFKNLKSTKTVSFSALGNSTECDSVFTLTLKKRPFKTYII